MYTVPVQEGQTIKDIAAQEYGAVEGIAQLMVDNPSVISDINVDLVAGTILNIQDIGFPGFDDALRLLLKQKGIQVNSGEVIIPGTGIGADAIGTGVIG